MLSSIKARLMVVSSSLILLLVGATVITRYLELDAVLQKSLRDSLQKQQGQVLELINLKSEVAAALAEFTANIPSVKELFAARDRQGLSALVMPIYDKLRDKAGLSQMQFATPRTVSFLRLHAPEKFDDDLSTIRPTMVTANREDRPVIGIEVGVAGMGIRAVAPMTLGKEKLGVVEVGMAVNDAMFMPLKNQFGFDVSIVVPEGDGFTFQARTHKMPISPASYPTLKKVMASGQPEFHRVTKDGKELMTLFMPLKDYSGKVVGVVTIPRDIGPELARLNGDIIRDVLIGLGAVVVILALVYLVIRAYVDKPIKTMITFFETVRQGDYKARLSGTMCGEMALLGSGLNELMTTIDQGLEQTRQAEREAADQARRAGEALGESRAKEERMEAMVARMRELAERISGVSGRLAETAEELSERVHATLDGAERQHRRFQDTAASMDEMRATVEEMAKNADSAADGAETAMDTARVGEGAVSEAVGSIEGVQRKMLALRDKMRDLGVKASDIGRIMSVINDIADQTNLLALNAAIEAARAGDAGRGFAVVADEVRKLAEKTMQATKEVGQAIAGIQDVAADNVTATDATTRDIVDATSLARRSGNCLAEIVRIVDGSVREAKAIAMATREQSQAAKDISRAVEEVNAVALETASGMESSAEAVRRLAGLAGELTGLVGEYRS